MVPLITSWYSSWFLLIYSSIFLEFLDIHHDYTVTREKTLGEAADRPVAQFNSKTTIIR
jgi:hypothetical protein